MSPDTFLKNQKGYPVLTKQLRTFISRLMRLKLPPWILLCDVGYIPGTHNHDSNQHDDNRMMSPGAFSDSLASPTPAEALHVQQNPKKPKDAAPHLRYIRHIQDEQPPRSTVEKYGSGYQDYLQVPLQPLTDNLESMTYEVFEKDPVKYDLYEQAIGQALREWADQGKPVSSPTGKVVVAVAGAGRGPLVTRALRASEAEGVEIELWAVEKNPNAYVLLQKHNIEEWQRQVTVVHSDMRSWKGPWRDDTSYLQMQNQAAGSQDQEMESSQPASDPPTSVPKPGHTPIDILISELLGSFADNELSPECLDGIIHLLAPQHGISIPASYTAFLTPIAAPKLHADIASRATWDATAPETPSVVWLHAVDFLSLEPAPAPPPKDHSAHQESTEPHKDKHSSRVGSFLPLNAAPTATIPHTQPVTGDYTTQPTILPAWTFTHFSQSATPNVTLSNGHNARYTKLDFRIRDRAVCHGLAGYFEALLYGTSELSTNPNTMEQKSRDMISWFPIFFPFKVCSAFLLCSINPVSQFRFVNFISHRPPFTQTFTAPKPHLTPHADINKKNPPSRHRSTSQTTPPSQSTCGARQTIVKCGMSGWSRCGAGIS